MAVLESAARMKGPIEQERAQIDAQLARFQYELLKSELRISLSNNDAEKAVTSLKTMSELRRSWSLSLAAKVGMAWPDLLTRAYNFRRTVRQA
jgi:replicative DNA helicase